MGSKLAISALVASFSVWGMIGSVSPGYGCALDSRPSLSLNGRLVGLNHQPARTEAELATWSYFVAPTTYRTGQPVLMSENRAEVARTLMPSALRRPWGWAFGDGTIAQGWQVRHTYAHPGRWKICVYAYNPESQRWDLFDQATITITR